MKKIWTWFTGLKRGWQIVIVIALGILVLSAAADDQQPTAKPTETTAEKSGPPTPTKMVPPSTATTERPSPLKKPTLTVMQRYKRDKFECDDGRAEVRIEHTLGERKESDKPDEHRFCATSMQVRFDDYEFSCDDKHDTSMTRKQKRFCAKKIRGWRWSKPKPEPPRTTEDSCASDAAALAATAMLSGRPILAAQAMKLAIEGGC